MRRLRVLLFASALVGSACNAPEQKSTDPVQISSVKQELSDTSHPTRDDIEDGNDRWGGTSAQAYVGAAGLCNNKAPSRKRYMNVRFDLSNIPNCATVTSATLTFTQIGCKTCGSQDVMTLERLTTSWSESSVLQTGPGVCSGTSSGSTPLHGNRSGNAITHTLNGIASGTGTFSFTGSAGSQLVADVQTMVSGSNYGWELTSDAVGNSADCSPISGGTTPTCSGTAAGCGAVKKIIATVEAATAADRPTLVVNYTLDNSRCDDGKPCTDNVCTASGCTYPNDNTNTCSDGIACTTDACSAGACVSTPVNSACDDNNVCTTDTCSATLGCQHSNNTLSCNDGVACTQNDVCSGGACHGTPNNALCDDGKVCTTDTCTLTGCTNANNTVACNDGASCTQGDVCGGGACSGTPSSALCNDGNACTTDTCNPSAVGANAAGCVYANFVGSCNDGIACTTGDACAGSTCVGTPNNSLCDDSNDCTADVCTAGAGCSHSALTDGTACASDGNPCHKSTCVGGACNTPNPGAPCRAGSCTGTVPNAVATAPAVCTSAGTCPAITTIACGSQPCNTAKTACQGSCATDADCVTGFYCNGTTCAAKLAQGSSCSRNAMCTNNTCVDKVCCNSACGGGNPNDCQACNASGVCTTLSGTSCQDGNACTTNDTCNAGTCVGGAAPNCNDANPCTVDTCLPATGCSNVAGNQGATCRTAAGVCDVPETCTGSSAVCPVNGFAAPGTQCRAPSCTGGTQSAVAVCTGSSAACPASVTKPCAPYVCGATACLANCASSADCSAGNFCSAGKCVPQKSAGQVCASNGDCVTGHCVDGVCCDTACTGQCQACNTQGNVGTCKPVSGAPPPGRTACAGDGSVCNGVCDGTNGATCTYAGASTRCRSPSCTNDVATLAASCDGAGKCPALQTQACAPFVCGASQCEGSCTTDAQCQAGLFCSAGKCVPLLGPGGKCVHDTDCKTGICVDQVCCDTRCTGQCEACDVAGLRGTCSPVPDGTPHGGRPACVSDKSACAGSCDGTTRDSCVYPGPSVQCRAPSCSGGTATVGAHCNGVGTCPAEERVDCGQACVGSQCGNACLADDACNQGEFCIAGICLPQRANGAACNDSNECASSYCVDGVCCDTACLGQCEACNVSGAAGTCSPVVGAPVGVRSACAGTDPTCAGKCDGTVRDRCFYPGASVVCTPPSCTNGVATLPQTCNSGGSCGPFQSQVCAPYSCGATQCAGNCTVDGQCAAGQYCAAGVCVAGLPTGAPCAGSNQCSSGFCVDGVCCDRACDGQCEACDDATSIGVCHTTTGRPHGIRPACGGTAACAGSCDGKNAAACLYPNNRVACGVAACASGIVHNAPTCNGAGTCVATQVTDCYPFGCAPDGASCAASCATADDCASGLVCNASACVRGPDAGVPGADAGSDSGSLVDAGTGGTPGTGGRAGTGGRSGTGASGGRAGQSGTPGPDAGAARDAGATDAGHRRPVGSGAVSKDEGGCGCRVGGAGSPSAGWLAVLGFGLLRFRRRRVRFVPSPRRDAPG